MTKKEFYHYYYEALKDIRQVGITRLPRSSAIVVEAGEYVGLHTQDRLIGVYDKGWNMCVIEAYDRVIKRFIKRYIRKGATIVYTPEESWKVNPNSILQMSAEVPQK